MKKIVLVAAMCALCGHGAWADESAPKPPAQPAPNRSQTNGLAGDGLADDYAGKFGLGITVGEPTGLSAKYWLNDTLAIDGAAGWSCYDDSEFYLRSDLLFHKFGLISVPKGKLAPYLGGGVFVRFRDEHRDDEAGLRVPVGLDYLFENAPVDIFAEFAPGLDLTPSVRADFSGGIGIRYWF